MYPYYLHVLFPVSQTRSHPMPDPPPYKIRARCLKLSVGFRFPSLAFDSQKCSLSLASRGTETAPRLVLPLVLFSCEPAVAAAAVRRRRREAENKRAAAFQHPMMTKSTTAAPQEPNEYKPTDSRSQGADIAR